MKKNRIVKTILLVAFFLALITLVVLYCVFPNEVKEFGYRVYDALNQPLPIVGVSLTAVLIFVWKLIISTNYGKQKLIQYDEKQKQLEKEYKEYLESANSQINLLESELNKLREQLSHTCDLSTNVRIKTFGKELSNYGKGKETTND